MISKLFKKKKKKLFLLQEIIKLFFYSISYHFISSIYLINALPKSLVVNDRYSIIIVLINYQHFYFLFPVSYYYLIFNRTNIFKRQFFPFTPLFVPASACTQSQTLNLNLYFFTFPILSGLVSLGGNTAHPL